MKLAFDDIKKYYKQGFWDDAKIANAVEKDCITNEQFEEITGHSIYEMGDFSAAQERKQNENKKALAEFLQNNPITWTDGCVYGVTEEDQNELALNLNQYQLQVAAGLPNVKLEWHPRHAACRDFTLEEYTGLVLAVKNFVYPYVQQCQTLKEKIYNAKNINELKAVAIVYEKAE